MPRWLLTLVIRVVDTKVLSEVILFSMLTSGDFMAAAKLVTVSTFHQKNVRNPNHHYFSKKYRNTPPICIAIRLQFVLQYFWYP